MDMIKPQIISSATSAIFHLYPYIILIAAAIRNFKESRSWTMNTLSIPLTHPPTTNATAEGLRESRVIKEGKGKKGKKEEKKRKEKKERKVLQREEKEEEETGKKEVGENRGERRKKFAITPALMSNTVIANRGLATIHGTATRMESGEHLTDTLPASQPMHADCECNTWRDDRSGEEGSASPLTQGYQSMPNAQHCINITPVLRTPNWRPTLAGFKMLSMISIISCLAGAVSGQEVTPVAGWFNTGVCQREPTPLATAHAAICTCCEQPVAMITLCAQPFWTPCLRSSLNWWVAEDPAIETVMWEPVATQPAVEPVQIQTVTLTQAGPKIGDVLRNLQEQLTTPADESVLASEVMVPWTPVLQPTHSAGYTNVKVGSWRLIVTVACLLATAVAGATDTELGGGTVLRTIKWSTGGRLLGLGWWLSLGSSLLSMFIYAATVSSTDLVSSNVKTLIRIVWTLAPAIIGAIALYGVWLGINNVTADILVDGTTSQQLCPNVTSMWTMVWWVITKIKLTRSLPALALLLGVTMPYIALLCLFPWMTRQATGMTWSTPVRLTLGPTSAVTNQLARSLDWGMSQGLSPWQYYVYAANVEIGTVTSRIDSSAAILFPFSYAQGDPVDTKTAPGLVQSTYTGTAHFISVACEVTERRAYVEDDPLVPTFCQCIDSLSDTAYEHWAGGQMDGQRCSR